MESSQKSEREPHTSMMAIFRGIKTGWRNFKCHLAKEPTKSLVRVKQHRKVEKGNSSQNITQINNRILRNKVVKATKLQMKDIETAITITMIMSYR